MNIGCGEFSIKQEKVIRNDFNSLAKYWEDFTKLFFDDIIIQNLPQKKDNILDLGCGSGKYSKLFSDFFDGVYGVDISENMIYEAVNKKNYNSHFLQCSGERLPFKSNFFDMVISVNVLHIMDQKDKIFEEVKRVGKEDCVFLVIDNIDEGSNQKDITNILKTFLKDVKNNYKSPRFLKKKTFFFVKLLKHEFHHRTYKDRGGFEKTMQKCGDCKIKYTKRDGILFGIAKIRFC